MKKTTFTLLAACGLLAAAASSAHAQAFFGLGSAGNTISLYSAPGVAPTTYAVNGTTGGESIVSIDYFASGTRQLFGIGSSGTLYTLAQSGANTYAATVNVANAVPGATVTDFNPVASRLRVYAGTSNFRVTPGVNPPTAASVTADGTLAFNSGDLNFGTTPNLTSAAYTNNFAGSTATSLYSLDFSLDALILNTGTPQFNGLMTVGTLTLAGARFDIAQATTGFDVLSLSAGSNVAYLSRGNALYTVDLGSGILTSVGTQLGTNIIDIAFVPEPGTYALIAAGGLLLGGIVVRRRQQAAA